MTYTTYQFYRDVYGGAMGEANFARYAGRAGYVLEAITLARVKSLYPAPSAETARAVGMAMGALVDGLAREEESGGRTVVLEAVGRHRIAYAATMQSAARTLRRAAAPFLRGLTDTAGTPLLSRALPQSRGRGV